MTNTAQPNTDREIRVFISSTFRDMHAERDYLVSHVFPVIRRACRERQVEFTEIDLRWGVTKEDAEQGKVVRICLEEINRCRPYFLSLLGERYGWAPLDTDLDHKAELLALFPFLENSLKEGLSVTEMEILHGVMDNPDMTGHCFFYLRDQTFTHALADQSNHSGDYFEFDTINQDKLNNLKSRILASGFPVCDNYAQLEDLGEKIKQDLLAMLDQRYPQEQLPTPLEAERLAHRNYARDRCQSYIANQSDLDRLNSHLKNKNHTPLIITGESGLGKSALLAYWLCQKQVQNTECFFIEHYIGIAGDADPVSVLRRIIAEIKYRTGDAEDMPSQPDDVVRDFPLWLARVRANDPLLLILDGLNQLEQEQLNWLPSFWPDTVSAYISVIPGEQLQTLTERDYPVFTLQGLETDRRQQLIENWLATYRKALSREQVSQLINAPQTQNPLFLRTVLEELRIFGYFEQLDNRINSLLSAQNPAELFALVLERLETDFGKNIVSQIMRALWAARRGLSETEIAGITGLSRLVISTFLMAIDAHLAKRGGLLNFFHDYLKQAVKQHCLENKETETHAHIKLAHYFEQQKLNDRVAEELPWQWQQAEQWDALKDCISAIPMFKVLYKKDDLELLAYWLAIGDQFDAGECYINSLDKWEIESNVEQSELAVLLSLLGGFFTERCVCLNTAETLHRRALAIRKKILGAEHQDTARSISSLALLLNDKGHYDEAEPLLRRALAIREKILGAEHPNTARSINNLAGSLNDQGHYDEAEPLFQNALGICEKVLGAAHPDTANCLNNLAELLQAQGHYDEAEPMFRRALAIREKVLGAAHPDTAISINSLASLLQDQGHYDEAEPLLRRSLVIREKALGAAHPYTARSIGGLANLLQAQGRYDEALPLLRRALAINEKILGAEHLETATSLNDLALLLKKQGYYGEAEQLFQSALAINEKILGSVHPYTASIRNNLGRLLQAQGRYDEAKPMFRRALAIREKVLGAAHPDTARSIGGLANLLQAQGHYDEAEPLLRRALAIHEKALGAEHPETVTSLNNLASLLLEQGHYDEAESLLRRSLAIREKALGAEHLDTAASLNNLAFLLSNQGNYDEAEPLYRCALAIRAKVLGAEHSDTAASLSSLAHLLKNQGHYDEAVQLYSCSLTIREKVLSSGHPDTANNLNNLAFLFENIGNYKEAERMYRRALVIMEKVSGAEHSNTQIIKDNIRSLLNGPLSNRELLWKQPDFITATGYAKSIAELSDQSSLTCSSLLLGARTANLAGRLEKPIEALTKHASLIEEAANNMGLTSGQIVIPILDRPVPMDEEIKALLQDYRQSTLECLIDALIDQLL